jgi:dienelactone hydrolase
MGPVSTRRHGAVQPAPLFSRRAGETGRPRSAAAAPVPPRVSWRWVIHPLDLVFAYALPRTRFFSDGWGDLDIVEREPVFQRLAEPPDRIALEFTSEQNGPLGAVRHGRFASPESRLPACARTARVQLVLPRGSPRGAILLLAASGDQGFAFRARFAAGLVARGLAALLLENPFYGARRPAEQRGGAVRRVSDLVLMAAAAIREGRALLAWLRDQGFGPLAVSGYSMGGQVAAMIGAATPFPVAVAPLAPSASPASVFTRGLLSRWVDLGALAEDGDVGGAHARLRRALARYDVRALPKPTGPAILVAADRDGIVPPDEPPLIARHWGAELRWVRGGHVSAALRSGDALRAAIVDALAAHSRSS